MGGKAFPCLQPAQGGFPAPLRAGEPRSAPARPKEVGPISFGRPRNETEALRWSPLPPSRSQFATVWSLKRVRVRTGFAVTG